MKVVTLTFPKDERIDEPYRGKEVTIRYEVKIGEAGEHECHAYVGDEILGYDTTRWVINGIRAGRPVEELAENVLLLPNGLLTSNGNNNL